MANQSDIVMPEFDSNETIQTYIRREQVARLAQQLPVNLIANLCVVISFYFIYSGKVHNTTLMVWIVYSQIVNLFGYYLAKICRKPKVSSNQTCLKNFSVYALADGLTFAAAVWIFFMPSGGFYNIFLFTVLLGVSAGGQATLLSHLATAVAFFLIITFNAIIRLASSGDENYYILAGMALVFAMVLMRIALSFNRNLIATWRLRYELEDELRQRKQMEKGLRESEQRYRYIVELSPDAILVQQNGKFAYANDSAINMFGIMPSDAVQNYGLMDFLPQAETRLSEDAITNAIDGQIGPLYAEARLQRIDGREVEVELRSKAIYYNTKPAMQIIIQDITNRKQMDRMKDEFISIVSHELRTPITAILGAVGIVRGMHMDSLDNKQQQLINIIYNNSQTLTGLVNDILDVSKLEGGKLLLNIAECNIDELLDELIKDNETYASQYDINLVLKRDLSVSKMLTDPMRLKQVLNNLISNAIKHSPEQDSVVIHATNFEGNLVVSVQDHGSGIPKTFHDRIFHKFEQSQDNSRKIIKGTGLGLYLSKSLVEQFGGEIWYETEENNGTTFFTKLPLN